MTILFVENHARFAAIVVQTFLVAHAVTVVPGLADARRALAARHFDLVLLDYDLDDGKGSELVPEILGRPDRPRIIAASSHADGNAALRQAGADAVCPKADFAQLQALMAALLEQPCGTLSLKQEASAGGRGRRQ